MFIMTFIVALVVGDVTSIRTKIAGALLPPNTVDIEITSHESQLEQPHVIQTPQTDVESLKSKLEKSLFFGSSPPIFSLEKNTCSPPVHDNVSQKEHTHVVEHHPNIPLQTKPSSFVPASNVEFITTNKCRAIKQCDISNPIPITKVSTPRPHVTPPPPPHEHVEISDTKTLVSAHQLPYTENEISKSRPTIPPPQTLQHQPLSTEKHDMAIMDLFPPSSLPTQSPSHISFSLPYPPQNIPINVPSNDDTSFAEPQTDQPFTDNCVPEVYEILHSPSKFPARVVSHTNVLDNTISLDIEHNRISIDNVKVLARVRKTEKKSKKVKKKKEKRSDKEHLPTVKGNPTSLFNRLFCSGRGDEPCIKAIFGVICGLIGGALFFVILAFSFKYSYDRAAWISLPFTIILILGLAFSSYFRCAVVIALPNLFSGRGRAALMAVIIAVMFTGPFVNIIDNFEEVSTSIACITEIVKNATEELKERLLESLREIYEQLKEMIEKLKRALEVIELALQPILDILIQLQIAFDAPKVALLNITKVSYSFIY